ncbi:hypothetical protein IE4803_CH02605 [Rhizobium etli bv. phaseoli str. IE4803]|nr:hypothetical protein IE4803_CH02605 [Rhizobium etli bv. phaseoli str. IE4803]
MAVAGIAVSRKVVPQITAEVKRLKALHGKEGEVKWKKAGYRSGILHLALINLLFNLVDKNVINLHVNFVEMRRYDHKLSGEQRTEGTVGRQLYNLILHRAIKLYHDRYSVSVYPDDGGCSRKLASLAPHLRIKAQRLFKADPRNVLNVIQQRNSSREPMLELLDVTLGALASYRNARYTVEDASSTKTRLAAYAFSRTRWNSIEGNVWRGRQCVLWNLEPSIDIAAGGASPAKTRAARI